MTSIFCDDICFEYADSLIFRRWSCELFSGNLVSVIGPNGSGKTTLLKLISGLILPNEGDIWLNNWNSKYEWKKFREKVGASLYPERGFNFRLSGYQNLEYIGALNGLTQKEIRRRTQKIFNKFDGRTFFEPRFSDLSLGQRCIFGIFVATIISNGIILVDEPTSPLDSKNRESVYFMLKELVRFGYLIVDTTHDPTLAEISDVILSSQEFVQ